MDTQYGNFPHIRLIHGCSNFLVIFNTDNCLINFYIFNQSKHFSRTFIHPIMFVSTFEDYLLFHKIYINSDTVIEAFNDFRKNNNYKFKIIPTLLS
jgi:hypothetical protein